jgi:fluoride ion exporter CrcB/FEX
MTRVRADTFTYRMGIAGELIPLAFLFVDMYLFTCLGNAMFTHTWEIGLLSINVLGTFALALMVQSASFAYHHGVAAAFSMSSDVPRYIMPLTTMFSSHCCQHVIAVCAPIIVLLRVVFSLIFVYGGHYLLY